MTLCLRLEDGNPTFQKNILLPSSRLKWTKMGFGFTHQNTVPTYHTTTWCHNPEHHNVKLRKDTVVQTYVWTKILNMSKLKMFNIWPLQSPRPHVGETRFRKGSEERGRIEEHLWELREEFTIDLCFLHIVRKIINKNCAFG
jgi:hypothetical protein